MELGDIEHPEETLRKCLEHLRLLRMLQDTEGWSLFCQYLSDSATLLEQVVLTTAQRPESLYEQEFTKGRARSLRQIKNFLEDYCETLEANARRITALMKEDEDEPRDESFDYRVESSEYREPASTGNAP